MTSETADLPTSAAPLLEEVKKWFVSAPWESAGGTAGEPTAAIVLCELLECSRLRHLLFTATARCAEQERASDRTERRFASTRVAAGDATAVRTNDASRCGRQPRTPSPCATPTITNAKMVCAAVRQRFQRLLANSSPCVKEFYRATRRADVILSSTAFRAISAAPAAPPSSACAGDIDAADVFWALILYLSAALCWRRRRSLEAQRRAEVFSEDVVSSSRDASERHPLHLHTSSRSSWWESTHSSLSSAEHLADVAVQHGAAGGTGTDLFSIALRSHYTIGKAAAANMSPSHCRSSLERLLPLLERHLSAAQLWRQPSLLAALDVLARGFATTERRVHAPSSGEGMGIAARCPLCYATALDNELAVEALVHLRCYAAAYHDAEDAEGGTGARHGRQRGAADGSDEAELNSCEVGWIAACRIALWNSCRASLWRLCHPPFFCAATSCPPYRELREGAERTAQHPGWSRRAVLEALWVSWWRAEVWLTPCPLSSETASPADAFFRDAAARWRSALLFMDVVLPTQEAAARDSCREGAGGGDATERCLRNQRALLAHLVQLPLVTERTPQALSPCRDQKSERICPTGTRNRSTSGTVLHWLSQHGDVPLLTLLCRSLDGGSAATVAGCAPMRKAIAGGAAAPAHFVRLGAAHWRDEKTEDGRSHRAALAAHEAAANCAVASMSVTAGQSVSTGPGRSLGSAASSVWGLHLVDSLGRNALDLACRRQHLPCVRFLLQAGLSPDSLTVLVSDNCVESLPLPLLQLLYDPSLLEGADSSRSTPRMGVAERLRQSTCPAAAASRTLAQLAFRLWTEKVRQLSIAPQAANDEGFVLDQWLAAYVRCQAAQDRVLRPAMAALEFDPYEPVARLVLLSVLMRKLSDWLDTTPPFVRYSPHDLPVGNSDNLRGDEASSWSPLTPSRLQPALLSLRQLRMHHTVALRLYTQLTCPLGRTLLRRAVDARCAVCDALAARGDRAASALLAAAATASTAGAGRGGDEVAKRDVVATPTTTSAPPVPVISSLAPSEPAKSRQELQVLYSRVLSESQTLEARLVAEYRRCLSAMEASDESERHCRRGGTPLWQQRPSPVATILSGSHCECCATATPRIHVNGGSRDNGDGSALYASAVIPSAMALRAARWETGAKPQSIQLQSRQQATAQHPADSSDCIVEPTMWSFMSTPQQVWLRLPEGVDVDRLLCENDGGGFGVVAEDMPPTAPVQRGDLVTFHCSSCGDGVSRSDGTSATIEQRKGPDAEECRGSPQFVVQQVFSERRTSPYLVWRSVTADEGTYQHRPPPARLVLPYATAVRPTPWAVAPRCTNTARGPSQDTVTLHACCLPVSYVARMTSAQLHSHHPLDWLLQTPQAATSPSPAVESGLADVLTALQSNMEWTARWALTVWAGHQPCWLEERMQPAGHSSGASRGRRDKVAKGALALLGREDSSHHDEEQLSGDMERDVVRLTDPFWTWDDAGVVDGHHSCPINDGRRMLRVLLAPTSGDTVPSEAHQLPGKGHWPSQAEGYSAAVTTDVVVGCAGVV
ncbi:hypothetical protein LSCM1_07642 [Leishmania martiniquensis]|uniref:Uncharacterized protein n=1 Tax=Leishmania martiniquensis TaxID=1580590 RepID=A0A836KSC3_9TRYP|nr:hypothetical protein LSCM1_07642 [Leishmania martiniquensis]